MKSSWSSVLKPTGLPILETDLLGFESDIGCRLPASFRDFLMKINGGDVVVEHELREEAQVVCIFPFHDPSATGVSITRARERQYVNFYMNKCFLLIGYGSIGDHFYIDLRKPDRCPVFNMYKDDILVRENYESWADDSVDIDGLACVRIAKDFNDLPSLILKGRCK